MAYKDPGGGNPFASILNAGVKAASKPSVATGARIGAAAGVKKAPAKKAPAKKAPAKKAPAKSTYRAPAPKAKAPAPRPAANRSAPIRATTPVRPVGNNASGTIAKTAVPPPPKPVSIDEYLAKDTTYQGQKTAYDKALADYTAQYNAELGKYGGEYNAASAKLGEDRKVSLTDLENDYAARGLMNSGLYGEAVQDANTQFDTKLADLNRAKAAYEADLATGKTNFATEQGLSLEQARQEALNRRLLSLG